MFLLLRLHWSGPRHGAQWDHDPVVVDQWSPRSPHLPRSRDSSNTHKWLQWRWWWCWNSDDGAGGSDNWTKGLKPKLWYGSSKSHPFTHENTLLCGSRADKLPQTIFHLFLCLLSVSGLAIIRPNTLKCLCCFNFCKTKQTFRKITHTRCYVQNRWKLTMKHDKNNCRVHLRKFITICADQLQRLGVKKKKWKENFWAFLFETISAWSPFNFIHHTSRLVASVQFYAASQGLGNSPK